MLTTFSRALAAARKERAMTCDRCGKDRVQLFRPPDPEMTGELWVCVACLTDDEYDFVAERQRRMPRE